MFTEYHLQADTTTALRKAILYSLTQQLLDDAVCETCRWTYSNAFVLLESEYLSLKSCYIDSRLLIKMLRPSDSIASRGSADRKADLCPEYV